MMWKSIECPNCGNEISVKGVREAQKCKWCRRLFEVHIKRVKGKLHWEAEPVDFVQQDMNMLSAEMEDNDDYRAYRMGRLEG